MYVAVFKFATNVRQFFFIWITNQHENFTKLSYLFDTQFMFVIELQITKVKLSSLLGTFPARSCNNGLWFPSQNQAPFLFNDGVTLACLDFP